MFEMDSSRRCAVDERHNNQEGESDPLYVVLSNNIDGTTVHSSPVTHSLTSTVGSKIGVGATARPGLHCGSQARRVLLRLSEAIDAVDNGLLLSLTLECTRRGTGRRTLHVLAILHQCRKQITLPVRVRHRRGNRRDDRVPTDKKNE